jgi:peptidoglycan/LPS O-acetylase OafA/YrhL
MPSFASDRDRSANIQVLRAIAALMVVFEHALADVERATGEHVIAIWPGGFGVTIFFVISGFIIHHSSAELFGRHNSWKDFAWRRLWRIVPLYYAATMLYVLMALFFSSTINRGSVHLDHLIGSLLFIPVHGVSPVYALGWSLNFEMMFYVSFAVALLMPERMALVALVAWLIALMVLHPLASPGTVAFVWTDYHIAAFLAGVLISVAANHWPRRHTLAAAVFAHVETYQIGIVPIALASALVATAAFTTTADIAGIGSLLGDSSYSLYLIHMFVIRGLAVAAPRLAPITLIGLIITLSCLAAVASHRFFEKPLLRLGQRLRQRYIDRRRPQSSCAANHSPAYVDEGG